VLITQAIVQAVFPLLAPSVQTLALTLAALNRMEWKQLYHLPDTRFRLNR